MVADRVLNVVTVSPYVPAPDMPYAGAQWYHHLLAGLADRAAVTLVAPATADNVRRQHERGPQAWRTILASPQRPLSQRLAGRMGRSFTATLGTRMPLPSLDWQVQAAMDAADAIDLQWTEVASMLPALRRRWPRKRIGVVEHDIYYRSIDRTREPVTYNVIRRQEPRLLNQADLVFTFKAEDATELRRAGVSGPAFQVLDPFFDTPHQLATGDGATVLFVAAFDRQVNVDGAIWFIDHVWPTILDTRPDARLVLAGGSPPAELTGRASSSITVTGFLADLAPAYLSAHLAVAPLFGEGGLKFKVPQAMAFGLPVVATPAGALGLPDAPQEALKVADTAADFAHHVVGLLRDAPSSQERESIARWVADRFRPARSVDTLLTNYSRSHDDL